MCSSDLIRYTDEEVLKLINSANDPSVANLIRAAFLTGARYGEMTESLVSSVDFAAKTWTVRGKTGGRTILLQKSAIEFFRDLTNGRAADDFLFLRSDGRRWKKSDQTRPFKELPLPVFREMEVSTPSDTPISLSR